jgi:hypothetical protein
VDRLVDAGYVLGALEAPGLDLFRRNRTESKNSGVSSDTDCRAEYCRGARKLQNVGERLEYILRPVAWKPLQQLGCALHTLHLIRELTACTPVLGAPAVRQQGCICDCLLWRTSKSMGRW